jgi:hypothetical protein
MAKAKAAERAAVEQAENARIEQEGVAAERVVLSYGKGKKYRGRAGVLRLA